ncbi:DUF4093 domain-containing protein [Atopobacter sp. AH10]|uniref:toprim domain-containing protein n=1 Tax=Atopobacter sp. AH10 TaxID=2315861 RepID=UPI000EF1F9D0|nr:DUF4093 domain-containing protein [Atopobacter sp. AH10]RLK62408.1 DUF4093 domain-containing protein [Atopobacter sp. AH10]
MVKNGMSPIYVVEGRDDTRRLKSVDPTCQTVETIGSSVPDEVLNRLLFLEQLGHPIVILTDPDVQGERIRRIVGQALDHPIHLHITRSEGKSLRAKHKSLGIEHASDETILRLLNQAKDLCQMSSSSLKRPDLWTSKMVRDYGLVGRDESRCLREYLGEKLTIGYVNGKHIVERLNQHGISKEQVESLLELFFKE